MSRATLARRYGPLLAVAAVQLLIIAVVPSNTPRASDQLGTRRGAPGATFGDEAAFEDGTGIGAPGEAGGAGTTGGGGGSTTVSSSSGGGGGGGGTGGGGGGGGGGTGGGDTSHCVKGRQYDPAIYAFAPHCAPKFTGNNGGKTAPIGVDSRTIKVVVMRGNYGTVVNGALTAAGSLPGDAEFDAFMHAAGKFINERYELYGRRVIMKQYKIQHGTGGQGKPDDQGLREEMRTMVQTEKPFAVIWNTPVSSATFDELTKLGVLNLGGFGFTDKFNQDHAPYHWDVHIGGNQLADIVSDWWCRRLYGDGNRKAEYAGTNKNEDMRTRNRQLGVLSTDDEENKALINQLDALIKQKCGPNASFGAHFYYYAQDATTAQDQRQTAVSRMLQPPAATSVMCFCDQVAPFFLYDQQEKENYYPENLFVASGYTDLDSSVQTYDHQLSPQRPANQYPQMENAFGLGQFGRQRARDKDDAAKVWHATGGTGTPYKDSTAQNDWEYYGLLGFLLQVSGPNLNATNIMASAQRAPALVASMTDPYINGQRSFGPGDFTWNDSVREAYWSPTGISEYRTSNNNPRPGTWRGLNDSRWYRRGEIPNAIISLPPKPRS